MKNTKIEYLYRDASNWKEWNTCIVCGTAAKEDVEEVFAIVGEDGYFIPEQVGLPLSRPSEEVTEDDHCWAELISIEETDLPETEPIAWTSVLLDFMEAKENGWDDAKYAVEEYE